MSGTLGRRVTNIERRTVSGEPLVFGVIDTLKDDGMVYVSGEPMTEPEFRAKYPDGIIFEIVYDSKPINN